VNDNQSHEFRVNGRRLSLLRQFVASLAHERRAPKPAVHAFSLMPGTAGVGSLSRLKRRLRRPGEIKTVEKAITALAATR
jgi:hypothetical protein